MRKGAGKEDGGGGVEAPLNLSMKSDTTPEKNYSGMHCTVTLVGFLKASLPCSYIFFYKTSFS